MANDFPAGLNLTEVLARQQAEGFNELATDQHRTLLRLLLEVLREPMFLLLIGAGGIYLAMGDAHEALILLGFVFIIILVTVLQERRTERALDALRDLSSPRALVMRGAALTRIPGREVVRGDILVLAEGDRIPADGRVLQAHELAVDESLLTGESVTVPKFAINGDATSLEDNNHRVFAGTLMVRGQGIVEVSAIGSQTELGRIGGSLKAIESESSPLQAEVGRLTRNLAFFGMILCVLLTLVFVWLRGGWLQGVLAGITLAMGILPQEFPVIMIVFLAMGARRIVAQRVLTRRLSAIETLGETTVLCVDKTGTLTQNKMAVAVLCAQGQQLDLRQRDRQQPLPETYHALVEYAVLASELEPHDPMELAFRGLAGQFLANTEHLHPDWSLVQEYELSPELPAMSHLWQASDLPQQVVASKGAPEAIVDLCHLDGAQQALVLGQAEALADQGLRVLGVARAIYLPQALPTHQHDFDFEFVGLLGLADPLRAEVPQAVAECHQAGIRVVMITGDHPRTAKAIAAQAGFPEVGVVLGSELVELDTAAFGLRIQHASVFARVTPQQKLAIVEGLKSNGEVVAMTGDGVNDAPALKAAHIGIAMGKRGTDVAREAASLVLLEDDFAAIVAAIHHGRRIFINLRRALIYTLAVHVPIIGLSILPLLLGLPLLLAPIHIAFLELVIDPACSLIFEAEQRDTGLMRASPRDPHEPLVGAGVLLFSVVEGGLATLVVALLYYGTLHWGVAIGEARSLAFVTLVLTNLMLILSNRSAQTGISALFGKMPVVALWVLGGALCGLFAVTEVPFFVASFEFSPLSADRWLFGCLAGGVGLLLFECAKILRNLLSRKVV